MEGNYNSSRHWVFDRREDNGLVHSDSFRKDKKRKGHRILEEGIFEPCHFDSSIFRNAKEEM
jgi:hypothetical protein